MDADASERLVHAHNAADPELRKYLGDLVVTDIQKCSTRDAIARRAQELWRANACAEGKDVEFWLQAEAELETADLEKSDRLRRTVNSFADLTAALNYVNGMLAFRELHGASLTNDLVQRVLAATFGALRRFTGPTLVIELFGVGPSEEWLSIASTQNEIAAAFAKELYSELDESLVTGKNTQGTIWELAKTGFLSAAAAETLKEQGVRSLALLPVRVADQQRTERPAFMLLALASSDGAFDKNDITNRILDFSVSLFELAVAVGRRDDARTRTLNSGEAFDSSAETQ